MLTFLHLPVLNVLFPNSLKPTLTFNFLLCTDFLFSLAYRNTQDCPFLKIFPKLVIPYSYYTIFLFSFITKLFKRLILYDFPLPFTFQSNTIIFCPYYFTETVKVIIDCLFGFKPMAH